MHKRDAERSALSRSRAETGSLAYWRATALMHEAQERAEDVERLLRKLTGGTS